MLEIVCTIGSKTPLILHKYTDDEMAGSTSNPVARFTTMSPREQAERRIYYGGEDGKTDPKKRIDARVKFPIFVGSEIG